MAKKKKQKTVYVYPPVGELRKMMAEIQPMKEEMQSWMGCRSFTLSVLPLHGTMEGLVAFTRKLKEEHIHEWFSDNPAALRVMDTYLADVGMVLGMVARLQSQEDSTARKDGH